MTRSVTPSARAPPDDPSPITTAIDGTRSRSIVCMLRAIAPPWPRSSAPAPGKAPGVSMRVITGRFILSAMAITRIALR
jgi:hypothetical protein